MAVPDLNSVAFPRLDDAHVAALERCAGATLKHYAWRGQNAQAAAAVAELRKLRPGYTVQKLAEEGIGFFDNPTFRKEYQRIIEGARKAGLPES